MVHNNFGPTVSRTRLLLITLIYSWSLYLTARACVQLILSMTTPKWGMPLEQLEGTNSKQRVKFSQSPGPCIESNNPTLRTYCYPGGCVPTFQAMMVAIIKAPGLKHILLLRVALTPDPQWLLQGT
jgi:hypothetical protein